MSTQKVPGMLHFPSSQARSGSAPELARKTAIRGLTPPRREPHENGIMRKAG
ncbi:hypothetical protein [Paraburkholderia lacunae]|uniref:hypothetical protein n=1 Tax=Paraburkholderia lacunae TaxID=2211104 RepID=UPI00140348DC|nr:hypothetical protein [Paraburkholderia lacunae]